MYGTVKEISLIDNNNLAYRGGMKKVYIFTPDNIDLKTARVIYMFDGQNLFKNADGTFPLGVYGCMEVDKLIYENKYNYIIVGIDNSDEYRDTELTMSEVKFGPLDERIPDKENFKNGHLDELGNFILQTVNPYLERYLERPVTAKHCYICGASSGGLAAFYLGIKHDYRAILAMSPALVLFTGESFNKFYNEKDKNIPIYLYNGYQPNYLGKDFMDLDLESQLALGTEREYNALKNAGFTDVTLDLREGCEHNEDNWKVIFEEFLKLREGK